MSWPTVPLGEVAPAAPATSEFDPDVSVWHLTLDQIESDTGLVAEKHVAPAREAGNSTFQFDTENVLYSKLRPYLNKVVLPDEPGIATTELVPLRPDRSRLEPAFLAHYLRSPQFVSFASECVAGAKMPRVIMSKFWQHEMPLPPMQEQRRLVELLDQVDELHLRRRESDQLMQQVIPAMFAARFGDPIDGTGPWPVVPVAHFVKEFQGGKSISAAPSDTNAGPYRVLKVSAVTWRDYDPSESKPLPTGYEPPTSHFVRPGDLLFSRANTSQLVGATAYVFDTPPNMLLPDKIWRFVWKDDDPVEPLFVWALFSHPAVRRVLGTLATGTSDSMRNISMAKVLDLRVTLPPVELQRRFATDVRSVVDVEARQRISRAVIADLSSAVTAEAFGRGSDG